MTFSRAWLADTAERVVRAFLVAFLGQYLASQTGLFSIGAAKAAAAAGIASGLSVVLSLLGAANSSGGISPASLVGARPKAAASTRRASSTGTHTLEVHVDTTQALSALKEVEVAAKRASKAVAAVKPPKQKRSDAGEASGLLVLAVLVLLIALIGGFTATHLLFWLLIVVVILAVVGLL